MLIAFLSPKEYSASATLMPENQSSGNRASSLLQQYGGMLGISGGAALDQEGMIPPLVYPNIVQSYTYQLELMEEPVFFSSYDTTATPKQFFSHIYEPSIFSYFKDYTIGLPSKIIDLFGTESQEESESPISDRNEVLKLSPIEMVTYSTLRDRMTIVSNEETGLLTLSVRMPDPQASAEVASAGIQLLKEYVKEYRTEKARQNLEFVQEQVKAAKKRFEEAQQRLAEFRDSNRNLATAKAQSREQELQSQYDLTFNLYNSLSQRLEQAKLDLQEETPVLAVIQPVTVPLEKSSPQRFFILAVAVILGIIGSIGFVLMRNWWESKQL